MILERDEGGFFKKVVTIHPFSSCRRFCTLHPRHRIYELGIRRKISDLGRLLAGMGDMERIARREKIDLIRATDPYFAGLLGWYLARKLRVPFCISLHANIPARFRLNPVGFWKSMQRTVASILPFWVVPQAQLLLPIRPSLKKEFLRYGGSAKKIRVIPHGVDLAPLLTMRNRKLFERLAIPTDKKIVSFAGRLSLENYLPDMLKLIELLSARNDFRLVIFGGGDQEPAVRFWTRRHPEFAQKVCLYPFQPRGVVAWLRRNSYISLCLMGGFSILEACAAGSPVIAYDVEWHREAIRHGITGYLVKERDVSGVAGYLQKLLNDPGRAHRMGREAKKWAKKNFSFRAARKKKIAVYQELLNATALNHG